VDVASLFARAQKEGRVGVARKSGLVDARLASPAEIVVTHIAGEGKETHSKPASAGDMVVRNRCEATGNEQYLVSADVFAERYEGPLGVAQGEGWRPYRSKGNPLEYMIVREQDGSFSFVAPWGEEMIAHPGDAIVRDPEAPSDIYRVARESFACTYDIISDNHDSLCGEFPNSPSDSRE
jgi:hypothetical protein